MQSINDTVLDSNKKFRVNFDGGDLSSDAGLLLLNEFISKMGFNKTLDDPKPSKGHYGTWLGGTKEPTSRDLLKQIIDRALEQTPATFEDFIKLLEAEKCEFKQSRRSVRLPGKKGFLRLKGLGDDYTEEAINDCKAAKAFFDEKKLAKLPTINSLKQEYAALVAEKKKLYAGQGSARNFMQEISMAQQNVQMLLDYRDTEHGRASDRDRR